MEINSERSLAFNFLLQLRTLCVKEISKRNDNLHEAECEDGLSVPANGNTSSYNDTLKDINHPIKSDNSNCISSFPIKKEKQISHQENKSINSNVKTYCCSKCDYLTECHSEYINHVVECSQNRSVECPLCLQTFIASKLDDHIKSTHLTPDIFLRGKNGSYNCIKCNFNAQHFSRFKLHLVTKIHRGLDICHICGMTVSLKELEAHQEKFHGRMGDNFVCTICGMIYASKGNLNRHVSSTHSKKKEFKCTKCEMTFKRHDTLLRHLITHSDDREHECHVCKRSFKSKPSLVEHIKNIHNKNRYQCKMCFRGFSDEVDRDNHMLTHEGFTFRCMMCGKGFKTHGRREAHFQAHLNASKKPKAAKLVIEQNSHHTKLKKSDFNETNETNYPSSKVSKRKAGDVLFPSNGQKPAKQDDIVEYDTRICDLKENSEGTQAAKRRKISTKGNSENKYPKLDGINKRRHIKTEVKKVSSFETVMKCDNSNNFDMYANLETCQPSISKSLGHQKVTDDEFISDRNIVMNVKVDNSPKKYFSNCVLVDDKQAIEKPGVKKESEGFWSYPFDVSNSEKEILQFGTPIVMQPCPTTPEEPIIYDLKNLPVIDSNFESFSSLQPVTSVAESSLFIDANSVYNVQDVDVKNLTEADIYPVHVEYYEVQTEDLDAGNLLHCANLETDSVASICSSEDVIALHIEAEKDCSVSLCNNVIEDKPSSKRTPATKKKTSVRQTSRKAPKNSKYPQTGKKVVMKNVCTDDDVFALPEFVIEEDDE